MTKKEREVIRKAVDDLMADGASGWKKTTGRGNFRLYKILGVNLGRKVIYIPKMPEFNPMASPGGCLEYFRLYK